MSLDLSLTDRDTGETVADMGWLRNPFGLCQWAEDNAEPGGDFSLWFVCNHWAYDKGDGIDRPLFKAVVDAYGARVRALERGSFHFDDGALRQFVGPDPEGEALRVRLGLRHDYHQPRPPGRAAITDMEILKEQPEVRPDTKGRWMVPQEWFSVPYRRYPLRWEWDASLARYQAWFAELVRFAYRLQDERYAFCCSN